MPGDNSYSYSFECAGTEASYNIYINSDDCSTNPYNVPMDCAASQSSYDNETRALFCRVLPPAKS